MKEKKHIKLAGFKVPQKMFPYLTLHHQPTGLLNGAQASDHLRNVLIILVHVSNLSRVFRVKGQHCVLQQSSRIVHFHKRRRRRFGVIKVGIDAGRPHRLRLTSLGGTARFGDCKSGRAGGSRRYNFALSLLLTLSTMMT